MFEVRQSAPPEEPPREPLCLARVELTSDQRAAREEILALILQHNPEPAPEELEAVEREWLAG